MIEKELKEWIDVYCQNLKTDFENLSEVALLEIIEWLKVDGFSEKEIVEQIKLIK